MKKTSIVIGLSFVFLGGLKGQDTIILRNNSTIVATVNEVGEEFILFTRINNQNKKVPEKISLTDVRRIKYKSGYVDKINKIDTSKADKDQIQFISSKTLKCTILEVNDEDVLVDLANKDTVLNIPIKMIANIKYANGFIEKRNDIIVEKKPDPVNPKQADKSPSSKTLSSASVANNTKKQATDIVANNSKFNAKSIKEDALEKQSSSSSKALTTPENTNPKSKKYLGICFVVDSATNLSRSFAMYQIFNSNKIISNGDTIIPVLADYPFGYDYSIQGFFKKNNAEFKIFKEGKKVNISTTKSWKDIYNKIATELAPTASIKKSIDVDEGSRQHVEESNIKDCLPGFELIKVPSATVVSKLKSFKLRYTPSKDPIKETTEIYGKYSTYNEKDLFFFRNSDVPEKLKEATRPLVFPLYKSVAPCLKYLSYGIQLKSEKKYLAALNCFFAALYSSNTIIASPYEKASARAMIYEEIYSTYSILNPQNLNTIALFKLGADLNNAYLNSEAAIKTREEYDNSIIELEKMCTAAEDAAKKIRGQKRLGGILAIASAAGSIASVSPIDNTFSDALMKQSVSILNQTFDQSSKASEALYEQFKNLEVDSKSFIIADGESVEIGKSFLADEVVYYLIVDSESCYNVLTSFSSDKTNLNKLFKDYNTSKNESILGDIYTHISEIEARVLNFELRKMKLPDNIKSSF